MIVHGCRSPCHIEANSTLGEPGWISRSAAPVESVTKRTFRHDLPPSVDLKTPRSRLGANGLPSAATQSVFGSAGCTRTVAICPTSRSPLKIQFLPPSTDLYRPRPMETLLRIFDDPVPAYTTLGSERATSIAPMEPTAI